MANDSLPLYLHFPRMYLYNLDVQRYASVHMWTKHVAVVAACLAAFLSLMLMKPTIWLLLQLKTSMETLNMVVRHSQQSASMLSLTAQVNHPALRVLTG